MEKVEYVSEMEWFAGPVTPKSVTAGIVHYTGKYGVTPDRIRINPKDLESSGLVTNDRMEIELCQQLLRYHLLLDQLILEEIPELR